MATSNELHDLGELLGQLTGSFLQYVGESWPWAADDSLEARGKIHELVDQQKDDIQAIVDHLDHNGVSPEFGAFPTSFTDLHYIDIAHLIEELVSHHEADLKLLREIANRNPGLLDEIIANHESTVEELKKLSDAS